ncbi:unnamed protein product [Ilex paraguariensis]|uniref:Cupin type-1 domain-containing protein n=1 Tax=Ilex paraguariensis TaxID=185542 RepID=A0ABC8ULZ6_9AQUA
MIATNSSKENVLIINKGDAIPVPLGGVSWWFNGGDLDVVIVFLGDTTEAHTPGQFTYFFVAGTLGILLGLSTEFVSRVYNINEEEAHLLMNSQTGVLIVKLEEDTKVQAGKLFVVPKFFNVSVIAEGEGMGVFSIQTSPKPLFGQLDGKTSERGVGCAKKSPLGLNIVSSNPPNATQVWPKMGHTLLTGGYVLGKRLAHTILELD